MRMSYGSAQCGCHMTYAATFTLNKIYRTAMKRILLMSVFAAAIMESHVFAEDTILARLTGWEYHEDSPPLYVGSRTVDDTNAENAVVRIVQDPDGQDYSGCIVYGGYAEGTGNAMNNMIVMTGGKVSDLVGGRTSGGAATGNVVIMSGGVASLIQGGGGSFTSTINNNSIHLVGTGYTGTVSGQNVTGSEISISSLHGASSFATRYANNVHLYGNQVKVGYIGETDSLIFHITEALTGASPMLTYTDVDGRGLTIGQSARIGELSFNGSEVKDWLKFEGKSITLIESECEISGLDYSKQVEITAGDGAVVAIATLGLENDGKRLVLSNIKGSSPIPEPTTGTLSLLALAGLCARRRRK